MATITKKELIDRIAERTQAKRVAVKSIIQAFLDEITREQGYSTRSELIRDGLRLLIRSRYDMDKMEGMVEGVIVVLYEHSADGQVSELRHLNMDIIKTYIHTDFKERAEKCSAILIFSGPAERVRSVIHTIEAINKVEAVQVFIA